MGKWQDFKHRKKILWASIKFQRFQDSDRIPENSDEILNVTKILEEVQAFPMDS